MNHVYRVVWNRVRKAFMVVAENVGNAGRAPSSPGAGTVGSCAAFVLTALSTSLFMSSAHAGGTTAANGATSVYQALNGVQVIDIATANASGLSHNRYVQYNVDKSGQILNNHSSQTSANALQSQLGGQIMPNMNLGKEAKVILNEVVAPNRSALNGYTEVVGGRADIVVANPYGLTCSGCGFINTDRATLTTGTPVIGSNGQLERFNVRQGEVAIEGQGLDGRNQKVLDLVARQVKINGQVNAQDLQIAAGTNDYGYQTRTASAITSTGDTPLYAIDSTALGGMYANRIQLLATENGVGVRMRGEAAASADDFTLNASGKIEINNAVSAEKNLAISTSGSGIQISGEDTSLSTKQNLNLTAQAGQVKLQDSTLSADKDLTVKAQNLDDQGDDAKRYAKGRTTLNTTGASQIDGANWGAGGALTVNTGSLNAEGGAQFYSGSEAASSDKSLSISTRQGDLDLANASVQTPGQLTLSAAANLNTGADTQIKSLDNYQVTAAAGISHAGRLEGAKAGSVSSGSDLSNSNLIQAGTTLNLNSGGDLSSKTLQAGGNITLSTEGDLSNTGLIYSTANVEVRKAAHISNQNLQALGQVSLTGASLDNRDTIKSGAALTLAVSGDLDNSGLLHAKGKIDIDADGAVTNHELVGEGVVEIDAGSLSNHGTVQADGQLTVNTDGALDNRGNLSSDAAVHLTAGGKLSNGKDGAPAKAATIVAGQGLTINAASLSNTDTLFANQALNLTTSGALDNQASISAKGNVTVNAGGAVSNHTLHAGGNLDLHGASLNNSHSLQAVGTLSANTVDATSGAKGLLDNQGEIKSNGTLSLTSGLLNNSSEVLSGAALNLSASGLNNSAGGEIGAVGALLGNFSGAVDNSGNISSNATLTLNALGHKITSNSLQAMQALTLNAGSLINNKRIIGGAGVSATITGTIDNHGTISAKDALTLTALAQRISNYSLLTGQSLQLNAGELVNRDRIEANQTLTAVLSDNLTNRAELNAQDKPERTASIKAGGNMTLDASGQIDSDNLHSGGDLLIKAAHLTNQNSLQAVGDLTVQLTKTPVQGASYTYRELNNLGDLKANGAITLTAGQLSNSGTVLGASDLTVTADSLTNNASMRALNNLLATLSGALTNNGSLIAGSPGSEPQAGDNASNKTLTISAASIDNSHHILAERNLSLTGTNALTNSGTVQSGQDMSLSSNAALTNQSTLNAGNNLTISAGSLSNDASALPGVGNQALIHAGATLTATTTSGALSNAERMQATGDISLTSASTLDNQLLRTNGNITLNAMSGQITNHTLYAVNDVTINAKALRNTLLMHAGQLMSLTITDLLENKLLENTPTNDGDGNTITPTLYSGAVAARDADADEYGATLKLNAGQIDNAGTITAKGIGKLTTTGSIGTIDSQRIESSGNLIINASGAVTNHDTILAGKDLDLDAKSLVNNSLIQANRNADVNTTGLLTNKHQIQAIGNLTVGAGTDLINQSLLKAGGNATLTATDGNIINHISEAVGNLSLSAQSVTNSSRLVSGDALNITTGELINDANISATNTLTATVAENLTNNGTLKSDGDLTTTVTGTLLNTAQMLAGGDLVATVNGDFHNQRTVKAIGNITTTVGGDLDNGNAGKTNIDIEDLFQAGNSLTATVTGNLTNHYLMQAVTGDLTTKVGDAKKGLNADLNNYASMLAGGTLHITASQHLNNYKTLLANGQLKLNVGQNLLNKNTLQAGTSIDATIGGTLTNGLTTEQRQEAGLAGKVVGKMLGMSGVTATVTGDLINYEVLHGNGAVALTAASLTNHGGISSTDALTLTSKTGDIVNENTLYSGSAMTLNAGRVLHNKSGAHVDSNDSVSTSSIKFINNGVFTVLKNLTISVSDSFVNETLLNGKSLTKVDGKSTITSGTRNQIASEGSAYTGMNAWRRDDFVTYEEKLAGDMSMADLQALQKAQLLATGEQSILSINYANSGKNFVGVISGDTVNIKGSGTFSNEEFALHKVVKSILWVEYEDKCAWPCDNYLGAWARTDPTKNTWAMSPSGKVYDNWNPGSGWTHLGYARTDDDLPGYIATAAQEAAVPGGQLHESSEVIARSGAGIFAKTLTMSTGALNNVGSPWATEKDKARQDVGERAKPTTKGSDFENNTDTDLPDIGDGTTVTGPLTGKISGGGKDPGAQGTNNVGTGGTGVTGPDGANADGEDVQDPRVSDPVDPGTGTTSPSVNAPNPVTPYENKPGEFSYSFNAPAITLPTDPYGYFVPTQSPSAGYLVETNPLFAVGSNFVGSNYMAERYGFSPDTMQTRLGDANYEGYLIRQQLLQLTGNNLIAGYGNEANQMVQLMDQAYGQGQKLGLTFGKTPTSEQLAQLTEDIVWMEEVVVNGIKVLAPKVYLAPRTVAEINSGAVISGTNSTIKADTLANTGGTIAGSDSLNIETRGNLTNTSGDITGGNVSMTSTQGSIINQTHAVTNGDDARRGTAIGKTASIGASGDLSLSAKQDITVIGADLSSGGNASLSAGNNIVVDTIVDQKTKTESTYSSGFMSSSSSTTLTDSKTNIGSQLNIGGNLSTDSKGNTTIAGSNVTVDGNLDSTAGGNFSVVSRQDTLTVNTESSESGWGVANSAYGSQTTTVNDFTGTNVKSELTVGGNADINAGKQIVLQGSDATINGDASLEGKQGISILDGHDVRRTTTTVETTQFLSMDTSGDSGAKASASASADGDRSKAEAKAGASAEAEGGVEFNLAKTSRTTTNTESSTSVGSTLNVGGDLAMKSDAGVVIQGSDVEAGGDLDVDAGSLTVRSGVSTSTSSTHTSSTSLGLFIDAEAGAEANAQAKASGQGVIGASAQANAEASAEATATLGMRSKESSENSYELTNKTASLKSGGDMSLNVSGTATFQGAEVASGGDMQIDANNIRNIAVQDIKTSSEYSQTNTAGLYAGAGVSVEAQAGAQATAAGLAVPNADASASAGAAAEVSVGVRQSTEIESKNSSEVTQVTNSFSSGGNFTRTAKDTIVDQGTQVDAGGDITQSARVIRDEAVSNQESSSESAYSHDLRVGLYAGAEAEAEAGAKANPLSMKKADADADADADAGFGGKVSAAVEFSTESESKSTAVTSSFKSGGSINSTSSDKTTLVGAQFEAGKDINVNAGSLEVKAARDTSSKSETNFEIEAEVKAGPGHASGSLGIDIGDQSESSDKAQTASLNAKGNLNITTKGSASFEGTDLSSGGDTEINAGGNVDFKAARNIEESDSVEFNLNIGGGSKKKDSEAEGAFGLGVSANDADTAQTGSIQSGGNLKIRSGGNTTLEGTQLEAGADATLSAGGSVQLKAAKSTDSSIGFGLSASAETATEKGKAENDAGAKVGLDIYQKNDSTKTAVKAQGKTTIEQGR